MDAAHDFSDVLDLVGIRQDDDLELLTHIELAMVLHASHVHLFRLNDAAVFFLLTELVEVEDICPGYGWQVIVPVDLQLSAVDDKGFTIAHRYNYRLAELLINVHQGFDTHSTCLDELFIQLKQAPLVAEVAGHA